MQTVSIFWFRRDLRLKDNAGLYHALMGEEQVLPIFIFDPAILDELEEDDARVSFIYREVQKIRDQFQEKVGSSLAVFHGEPLDVFKQLAKDYDVKTVYTNHDYEPYAIKRDKDIGEFLLGQNIAFRTFKDQVIFEKKDVLKDDGDPYVVYTPYMKKWKENFDADKDIRHYRSEDHLDNLIENSRLPNLDLSDMGFVKSKIEVPEYDVSKSMISSYKETRNFPAKKGTSRLGPHLRFGTVSVRRMVEKAMETKEETFWNELIWREFFMQILYHFPKTTDNAFYAKYDRIEWRNNEDEFEAWKNGKTGYLMVDAGMRQLNETGYMHNRVRMLTASFLCKHLLIDWRWGEAYFASRLLDYEMSSNVGNWQWAAGSGVDAAPYFRIFNPMTQVDKFDKDRKYISQWVPEYESEDYPEKIVDHKEARERCLEVYKAALD